MRTRAHTEGDDEVGIRVDLAAVTGDTVLEEEGCAGGRLVDELWGDTVYAHATLEELADDAAESTAAATVVGGRG
jgi:hypothetical protein